MKRALRVQPGKGFETWRLDFPPVNAIGPELLSAVEARLDHVLKDDSVAVVVLASSLGVFCAGADAKWMAGMYRSLTFDAFLERFTSLMDRFRQLGQLIQQSNVLFIAALEGHALAGGLELAAACDLRYATDDDRIQIGVPEMALFGELPSGGGGTQYLARLMGRSRALRFILEAEPCSPAVAFQLGLVDRLCPRGELINVCQALAKRLAAVAGRPGIAAAKRAISDGLDLPMADALKFDAGIHRATMQSDAFAKGVLAFIDRYGKE